MAGLSRLKDGSFTTWSTDEGLSHDMVRSIYQDRAGALWLGTEGGGLSLFEGGRITKTYAAKDNIGGDAVWGIFEDSASTLWIGTFGGDLGRRQGGVFQAITKKDGLPVTLVSSFAEHDGALWLGSDGLIRYKDGVFTVWGPEHGVPKARVNGLLEDSRGTLWIATASGLGRMERDRATLYTSKEGLAGDNAVSVTEDTDGALWIATSGGLSRLKDGALKSFTRAAGLYDSALHHVLVDDAGSLWMSTNKGIFSIRKADIEAYEAGLIPRVPSRAFGVADGMKNAECNGGTQPAGFKAKDGLLWFPTIEGASAIDPARIRTNPRPPPVYIESVLADHAPMPYAAGSPLTLAAGSRNLEVHYTALSLIDPSKMQFKYMLDGYDKEWNDAGTRRSAYYTNLPPGSYRFRVAASNNDGVWSEAGAELSFYLEPFFYETKAFAALCALLAFIAIVFVYGVRVNYLKRRERALMKHNAELAEALAAAREASRLKGEFVATISHELCTPLNSIVNIPDGLMSLFHRQEVASCSKCASRFEIEPGDVITPETACPECQATGTLTIEVAWQLGGDGAAVIKHLTTLKRAGAHLQGIIDDVLDFSKLEAGKMSIERKTVRVRDLFEDLTSTLAPLAQERGVTLEITGAPPDLELRADPVKCAQILINLASNAIKFSDKGGIVSVSAEREGDLACVFTVTDRGIGLAPEDHTVIFESFHQVDGSHTRRVGGAGLGLAITKQLVELHGGRIWLTSRLGEGSAFFVRLPLGLDPTLAMDDQGDPAPRRPRSKKVVLALDDEPVALETVKLALRPLGCEVVCLLDPGKLDAMVSAVMPDLLILDIMMPRVSGLRLLRELRTSDRTKRMPILVSSAYHENRDICLSLGAAWLGKPFRAADLREMVGELLREARDDGAREAARV
jgi:signal transduction histidine kinase/CheY-like chemotaxis protein